MILVYNMLWWHLCQLQCLVLTDVSLTQSRFLNKILASALSSGVNKSYHTSGNHLASHDFCIKKISFGITTTVIILLPLLMVLQLFIMYSYFYYYTYYYFMCTHSAAVSLFISTSYEINDT